MWSCFQECPHGQHRAASVSLTQDSEVLSHVRGGTAAMTTTELLCEPRAAELGSTRARPPEAAPYSVRCTTRQCSSQRRKVLTFLRHNLPLRVTKGQKHHRTQTSTQQLCAQGPRTASAKWCQHQPVSLRDSVFKKVIHSYDGHSEYVTKVTDPSARVQGLRPPRAGSSASAWPGPPSAREEVQAPAHRRPRSQAARQQPPQSHREAPACAWPRPAGDPANLGLAWDTPQGSRCEGPRAAISHPRTARMLKTCTT